MQIFAFMSWVRVVFPFFPHTRTADMCPSRSAVPLPFLQHDMGSGGHEGRAAAAGQGRSGQRRWSQGGKLGYALLLNRCAPPSLSLADDG